MMLPGWFNQIKDIQAQIDLERDVIASSMNEQGQGGGGTKQKSPEIS